MSGPQDLTGLLSFGAELTLNLVGPLHLLLGHGAMDMPHTLITLIMILAQHPVMLIQTLKGERLHRVEGDGIRMMCTGWLMDRMRHGRFRKFTIFIGLMPDSGSALVFIRVQGMDGHFTF